MTNGWNKWRSKVEKEHPEILNRAAKAVFEEVRVDFVTSSIFLLLSQKERTQMIRKSIRERYERILKGEV